MNRDSSRGLSKYMPGGAPGSPDNPEVKKLIDEGKISAPPLQPYSDQPHVHGEPVLSVAEGPVEPPLATDH